MDKFSPSFLPIVSSAPKQRVLPRNRYPAGTLGDGRQSTAAKAKVNGSTG